MAPQRVQLLLQALDPVWASHLGLFANALKPDARQLKVGVALRQSRQCEVANARLALVLHLAGLKLARGCIVPRRSVEQIAHKAAHLLDVT
ncbi:hypothetical protein C7S18_09715 [Ahniella affigens]|uniref:Uncharacterized protein n=1 Tax=Ahniella affigens TaxID=2021234 RepID=A0A2P1PRH6_9GAMM|nr:hypothetical protein C7S18_09715 [Ahniella affigens]